VRKEEAFRGRVLQALDVVGVDRFADSAVMIQVRIKTQPIHQWTVGREFNRRMKLAFEREGIEMPFPTRTIYFGNDAAGLAGRAPNGAKARKSG